MEQYPQAHARECGGMEQYTQAYAGERGWQWNSTLKHRLESVGGAMSSKLGANSRGGPMHVSQNLDGNQSPSAVPETQVHFVLAT